MHAGEYKCAARSLHLVKEKHEVDEESEQKSDDLDLVEVPSQRALNKERTIPPHLVTIIVLYCTVHTRKID